MGRNKVSRNYVPILQKSKNGRGSTRKRMPIILGTFIGISALLYLIFFAKFNLNVKNGDNVVGELENSLFLELERESPKLTPIQTIQLEDTKETPKLDVPIPVNEDMKLTPQKRDPPKTDPPNTNHHEHEHEPLPPKNIEEDLKEIKDSKEEVPEKKKKQVNPTEIVGNETVINLSKIPQEGPPTNEKVGPVPIETVPLLRSAKSNAEFSVSSLIATQPNFTCTNISHRYLTLEQFYQQLRDYGDYPDQKDGKHFPIARDADSWLHGKKIPLLKFRQIKKKILAVIIPLRGRCDQLAGIIPFLNHFLQKRNFRIYVIEQADQWKFSRGTLLNAGTIIAQRDAREKNFTIDYYIFHDVDMYPMHGDNAYSYFPDKVVYRVGLRNDVRGRHRSIKKERRFRKCYAYGGISQITPEIFELINGFSTRYWGWGREDDDFHLRIHSYLSRTGRKKWLGKRQGFMTKFERRAPFNNVGKTWSIPFTSDKKTVDAPIVVFKEFDSFRRMSANNKWKRAQENGLSQTEFEVLDVQDLLLMKFVSIKFTFEDNRGYQNLNKTKEDLKKEKKDLEDFYVAEEEAEKKRKKKAKREAAKARKRKAKAAAAKKRKEAAEKKKKAEEERKKKEEEEMKKLSKEEKMSKIRKEIERLKKEKEIELKQIAEEERKREIEERLKRMSKKELSGYEKRKKIAEEVEKKRRKKREEKERKEEEKRRKEEEKRKEEKAKKIQELYNP